MSLPRPRPSAGLIGLLAMCLGCAGEGLGAIDPCDPSVDPDITLSCDVQPILTTSCALSGCHAGAAPQEGMNLAAGLTHSHVVNVPSAQVASLDRVEPGDPDQSYLVHKIEGTQVSVGGSGDRMPQTGCCLSQEQIDTIRSWIAAGAQNN